MLNPNGPVHPHTNAVADADGTPNSSGHDTDNNNNNNNNSNSINETTTGNTLGFDYANWEDAAEDFNFLGESASLPIDSTTGTVTTAATAGFSPVNTTTNTAASPTDYALQLQQYQNMLIETQNIAGFKQQMSSHRGKNIGQSGSTGSPGTPASAAELVSMGASTNEDERHSAKTAAISSTIPVRMSISNNKQQRLLDPRDQTAVTFSQASQAHDHTQNGSLPPQQSPYTQIPYAVSPSPMTPFVQAYTGSPNSLMSQPSGPYQQQLALQMAQMTAASQQQILRSSYNTTSPGSSSNLSMTNTGLRGGRGTFRKHREPPQPRTKVRPCDHCRRRKTKCVMIPEINSCKMCQAKGLKCTFTESSSSLKRGLSSSETTSKRMRIEDPTIQPPPNIPVRDVHPIRDYATMPGRSLLKKTLSLQYPRSSFYVGTTAIYDPIFLERISLDKIDQFTLDKTNSIRKVSDTVQFVLRDDFSEALYEKSERDADIVERYVAPHGQALIDLYFRTVHPSFPVLHKKIFLEKYSRTHREFGAPLLAAVYLLAIQWWDYDPTLSQFPKPNVESLHRFAIRSFGDVIHRPKLSAVQAGLLLLQCRTPDTSDKNWLLCSQVVALAEDLGLGLECGNWRLPRWERGLRRRLAWAVYVQDKWSSLLEARPSHIIEGKNWLVKKVSDEDFPEKGNDLDSMKAGSADVENGKKSFKQMISLSDILSQILDTFYTPSGMEQIRSIDKVLSNAKPLQLKLRNWYHSLPKELQMSSLKPRQFNNNGTLQLSYFATEITLHRRIICVLYQQSDPAPSQELVRVCRNAAHTRLIASIEFARDLKAEHMQAFWYSSAVNNFALIGVFAALLYVTSGSTSEAASYKEQLFDYRWILKVNSRSFDIASRALEKIDGLLKNIPGLLNEYNSASAIASTGYESHKREKVEKGKTTSATTTTTADKPSLTSTSKKSAKEEKHNKDKSDGKLTDAAGTSSRASDVATSLTHKGSIKGSIGSLSSLQNGKSPIKLMKHGRSQQNQTDSADDSDNATPLHDDMATPMHATTPASQGSAQSAVKKEDTL
ncbi:hypothetical protein FOA43_004200 [Brettanomyces nanus]|uniref:Zn(2)-C6 fungal-type domain-containing protein n=1 Tax=Eeniella nana TaxID=13502 RepID=A0A875S648_EENNA|nr:uncharacterized protein FOA43_004200 [Brettanomyces nanus]QPG76806.1 hypothetical protein FOA43_004200 [Brettanomyces nanus]